MPDIKTRVRAQAGESSIDSEGNVYFVHHHYKEGIMLEADIYIIQPKKKDARE